MNTQEQRLAIDMMLRRDIANLRSTFLSATDTYMVAGSNSVIARSSAAEFHRLISDQPHLDAVCIWRAAAERSMLAEHLIDVGGHPAYQRLGHRLLELLVRMELAGLPTHNTLSMPLDLVTLADMLGLTIEHASRTITRMREDSLIEWNDRYIKILGRKRLAEANDFDPPYLHPGGFPPELNRRNG